MHRRSGADVREVLDVDVSPERGAVTEDRVAADVTIVCDVHIGHEQVVVADPRLAAAAGRAAVDGDELSKDVAASDRQTRSLATILQILWREANGRHRVDLAAAAHPG